MTSARARSTVSTRYTAVAIALHWIIAAVIAVIGIIVLISGSVLWGIILLVVAAAVGPGGYSIFQRRS